MSRSANFITIKNTDEELVIKDIGPWDTYFSVTNDIGNVVDYLVETGTLSSKQKLFYYDSDNQLSEVIVENNKFVRFA